MKECKFCKKKFKRNEQLNYHLDTHNLKSERQLKCDKCEKTFSHPSNLKQHRNSHSGDKTVECKVCGVKFKYQAQLKRHLKVPTVAHQPCPHCCACFKYYKRLRVHIGETHPGENTDPFPEENKMSGRKRRSSRGITPVPKASEMDNQIENVSSDEGEEGILPTKTSSAATSNEGSRAPQPVPDSHALLPVSGQPTPNEEEDDDVDFIPETQPPPKKPKRVIFATETDQHDEDSDQVNSMDSIISNEEDDAPGGGDGKGESGSAGEGAGVGPEETTMIRKDYDSTKEMRHEDQVNNDEGNPDNASPHFEGASQFQNYSQKEDRTGSKVESSAHKLNQLATQDKFEFMSNAKPFKPRLHPPKSSEFRLKHNADDEDYCIIPFSRLTMEMWKFRKLGLDEEIEVVTDHQVDDVKQIMQFMHGGGLPTRFSNLLAQEFGPLVTAAIIIQTMLSLDIETILSYHNELCTWKLGWLSSEALSLFGGFICQLKLDRSISFETLDKIRAQLGNNVSTAFIFDNRIHRPTAVPIKKLKLVLKLMMSSFQQHCANKLDHSFMIDNSYTWGKRSYVWQCISNLWIDELAAGNIDAHIYDAVVAHSNIMNVGTVEKFRFEMIESQRTIAVNVHEFLVPKSQDTSNANFQSKVTEVDVERALHAIHFPSSKPFDGESISEGVCCVLSALGRNDLLSFILDNDADLSSVINNNTEIGLKILAIFFTLSHQVGIDYFAKNFMSIFDANDWSAVLKTFSAEQFLNFFANPNFENLPHELIYKFAVIWSCNAAGKTAEFGLDFKADQDVKDKFTLVYSIINLLELGHILHVLFQHELIPTKDIMEARDVLEK